MIKQRKFAQTNLTLSEIAFGAMRLDENAISEKNALELLEFIVDSGVDTFHTSFEYTTHEYFIKIFKKLLSSRPGFKPKHIVKLGSPHFDDQNRFNKERLLQGVEQQLNELRTDCLDIVQWLVRSQPINNEDRIKILNDDREEIRSVFEALKKEGKIKYLTSFPYSAEFTEAFYQESYADGLVTYLNLAEKEYVPFLADGSKGFLAIRPLFAGQFTPKRFDAFLKERPEFLPLAEKYGLNPDNILDFALAYPLLHPNVSSVIISINTLEQAKSLVETAKSFKADEARFGEITSLLP